MIRKTNIKDVKIQGGFWGEKQKNIAEITVPYIWRALNNQIPGAKKSNAVDNFMIASGKKNNPFYGLVSQDSDLFKWMEAASYALLLDGTEDIEKNLDCIIDLLEEAQQKDGYLNSYFILNGLKDKWGYLKESCQLYCAGHLIEAAVAHCEVTGKRKLLDIACKYADCIDRSFGKEEGKIRGYDGHAEIELALYRLYECTGIEKYRKLAKYFVEERGRKPYFFSMEKKNSEIRGNLVYELEEDTFQHSQSHLMIREQKEVKGHAVKAMYFFSGAADEARVEEDESLKDALKILWTDLTERKMYLTGAIGSCEYGESFSYAYDLPPDLMYGETCASIGLFFWAYRMLLLETKGMYADIMEKALYNGILCGISERGTEFFYTNALEIDPERCDKRKEYMHLEKERQAWFECPCCPPNITRLILSFQNYFYTFEEDTLCIHHFADSQFSDSVWNCIQNTNYPENGMLKFYIQSKKDGLVKIRIPGWCKEYSVMVNNEEKNSFHRLWNGYVMIPVQAEIKYTIVLNLNMEPQKICANNRVSSLNGKIAVTRGPIVYCGEEVDNPQIEKIKIAQETKIMEDERKLYMDGYRVENCVKGLYGERVICRVPCKVTLIPYYQWNNRGTGRMQVFFDEV